MINGILQNSQASFHVGPSALSLGNERVPSQQKEMHSAADVVSVQQPTLMTDDEASSAMLEIQSTLQENSLTGLSIHDGLDASRVFSLLEGL